MMSRRMALLLSLMLLIMAVGCTEEGRGPIDLSTYADKWESLGGLSDIQQKVREIGVPVLRDWDGSREMFPIGFYLIQSVADGERHHVVVLKWIEPRANRVVAFRVVPLGDEELPQAHSWINVSALEYLENDEGPVKTASVLISDRMCRLLKSRRIRIFLKNGKDGPFMERIVKQ